MIRFKQIAVVQETADTNATLYAIDEEGRLWFRSIMNSDMMWLRATMPEEDGD